ncbi:MAG: extracellular solute-binding protein, partial [Defluviitoga tunisiensis]
MKKVLALLMILVLAFSAFSVTITMTAGAVGTELETLYKQIDMFMKENPDITVQVMPMPNSSTDRHDLYVTYLASGVPDPDVLMLDVIWPAEFAPFLVDLTDDYKYFELDEFFPGTVDSNTVDGRLVSVPWFTDAGILYYRKDLLQKYGYDVPKTWDELFNIAKDISAKEGINGFVWQGARYEGLTCDVMEFVHSFGGEIIESGDVVVD